MANTNLTVDQVTNRAQMVLHQKLNFIGNIQRQYDDSYKTGGAKAGEDIRIKLPNEFTVRSGKTLNVQDVETQSVTMSTSTQKGVDMNFSQQELTQDISLFSENYIEPAMSALAAVVESDALSMYKDIYNEVSDLSEDPVLKDILEMGSRLTENLAPYADRCLLLRSRSEVALIDALSGLFSASSNLDKHYREGQLANNFVGFQKVFTNTMLPNHVGGTDDGTADYLINNGTLNGSTMTVDTGAGTFKKGDIFYLNGTYRVHPETKADTAKHQPFVCTNDEAASTTSIEVSPSGVSSGGRQNINANWTDGKALHKVESDNRVTLTSATDIGASQTYGIDLAFNKNAFAFATADLEVPKGVHFAGRRVQDGISLRMVRDYDINNDNMPCRLDILYGYKTIRAQLACRGGFIA
jgi:hypothetical protein